VGTATSRSSLRLLRGQETIVKAIWTLVLEDYWSACLERRTADPRKGPGPLSAWTSLSEQPPEVITMEDKTPRVSRRAAFPAPTGRSATMLPFVLSSKRSLPEDFHAYWPLIQKCASFVAATTTEVVAYLTVDEEGGSSSVLRVEHLGVGGSVTADGKLRGGVFMAAAAAATTRGTTTTTTRLYNCVVRDHFGDVVGDDGRVERLRPLISKSPSHTLRPQEVAWVSDGVPYEGPRPLFKLVVGKIRQWDWRWTPNPSTKADAPLVFTNQPSSRRPWTRVDTRTAKHRTAFRTVLASRDLDHVADRLEQLADITTLQDLALARDNTTTIFPPFFSSHKRHHHHHKGKGLSQTQAALTHDERRRLSSLLSKLPPSSGGARPRRKQTSSSSLAAASLRHGGRTDRTIAFIAARGY